jgi:Protein of unknown function (DUF2501)
MGQGLRRMPSAEIMRRMWKTCSIAIIVMAQFAAPPANSQLLDQLKSGITGSNQGGAGMLGGGLPSVSQASPSNLAGVLQYCVKNNYLSGGDANSVKDSLTSKITGGGHNPPGNQYQSGSNGLLETGNGNNFSLGGGGIKDQATKKVCDLVLSHAKSLH